MKMVRLDKSTRSTLHDVGTSCSSSSCCVRRVRREPGVMILIKFQIRLMLTYKQGTSTTGTEIAQMMANDR